MGRIARGEPEGVDILHPTENFLEFENRPTQNFPHSENQTVEIPTITTNIVDAGGERG